MASKKRSDLQDLHEFIRDHMVTKGDLRALATKDDVRAIMRKEMPSIIRDETKDIRDELANIRRDLKELTSKVDNIIGLPKEIDHALDRIRRIEKHLGIEADIAA